MGAKVVRGPDWDWGNQDGGSGECGRVTKIRGWDGEGSISVASVLWASTGLNNVYRIGHKGKVDLRCEVAANCGTIYINHLPVLGRSTNVGGGASVSTVSGATSAAGANPRMVVSHTRSPFLVGERVRVCVPLPQLKAMQEGHGGWNHKMAEYINQVGLVHRITDKGDVRVQYDGCCTRWTIHPSALTRVSGSAGGAVGGGEVQLGSQGQHCYTPGDRVTIISDEEKVKQYQAGHGEWIEHMRNVSILKLTIYFNVNLLMHKLFFWRFLRYNLR